MIWHSSEKEAVLNFFSVGADKGLDGNKAEEIYSSLLSETKSELSFLKTFLKQFNSYFFIFMSVAAVISAVVSVAFDMNTWISSIIIILLMLIDSLWNAYQEYKADKAMEDVEKLTAATANVLRDGTVSQIPAEKLIPGDIIILSEGDYIPADCRLIETSGLRCDEYILTGETVYVDKDCDFLGEDITEIYNRKNMAYAGCSVMHGTAKAVVTEVGSATEIAKQSILTTEKNDNLALCSKTINTVYKYAFFTVSVVSVLYFLVSILLNLNTSGQLGFAGLVINTFMDAVALAIAAIPETLPTVLTIIIGLGVRKLAAGGVLVRKPNEIEKIANVTVVCADKTGVLTGDDMTVQKVFDGSDVLNVDEDNITSQAQMLLKLGMICGNGINYLENASHAIKDSTDTAIADACMRFTGISDTDAINTYPMLGSVPFDNDRRLITTINMINGKPFVITKGAPESLLQICGNIGYEAGMKIADAMAEDALRIIAVAYKPIDEVPAIPSAAELECELSFVGFIGLYDSPGENAVRSVDSAERAGIRTVMLTGDNLITAKAVARRMGIFHDGMKAITGEELAAMSDEELDKEITSYSVFARISPDDRYRIVRAFQHNNEVVAVMGSSIDDAPYLNKADVGIAIDATSTDVSRRASDVVIKDNSISSIIGVIKSAKTMFANIKKVVHYLISCNLAELLVLFIGMLFFGSPVLTAIQLLFINFVTDALPSLSLGLAPAENKILKSRSGKTDRIFTSRSIISIGIQSVILCVLTIIAYAVGATAGGTVMGNTVALAVLGFSQILHIFSCYSEKTVFGGNILKNKFIFPAVGISLLLMLIILLTPISTAFGLIMMSGSQWTTVLLLTLSFFIADELIKLGFWIYKRFSK